ncbi:VPA1262 family N-terminal domain-containing protein [Burkholderia ubonensis]|uniref:VPA1262 family N-terminal domain-containing protein n=1 Tax=Burkholderia ubonensis TaxID=101571 RepID=UPI001114DE67|nr:VPA1262 family N-terminal domain-containing protein [Burkholderia ubonensis]
MQKKGEMGRLLFTTVTELAQGRSLPTTMSGIDAFKLKRNDERLFFRRVILSKEDAVNWYRSLGEGERNTPVPTRENDREELDGVPIRVSRLEDVQPWPALGLPIAEDLFSGPGGRTIDPAPFIGSVPGRLHRRFGDRSGLEAFLEDALARAFVARRMHIDLFEYREYLGSAVYIAPDPVIRQIDYFMVPAKNGQGERIVYRVVPRPGQSLEGVHVTSFDKEARLLTSFETRALPANGILDVEKGTCMGEYGFVISHDRHGVLAYQPSVPFLRQMNLSIRAAPRSARTVSVPSSDSADSPRTEYPAAMGSELASKSVLGEVRNPGASVRVAVEAMWRERLADAKRYGQRWFDEGTRDEAIHLIRELLRAARSRVIIADPYLGTLQLGQFLYAVHGSEVSVTLLTTRLAFNTTAAESKLDLLKSFKDGLDSLNKYQQLAPDVRILPSSSLHDRFLVVDDDVWFVGNSLNSLGEKASMIVRLPNSNEVIERLQKLAAKAPSLDAYIDTLPNGEQGGADE